MTTYVLRDGALIEKHLAPAKHTSRPAVHVISDTMAPLKHHGTGAVIDSKAEFRRHTRMAGCEEVGTDPSIRQAQSRRDPPMTEYANDVRRALQELRSR